MALELERQANRGASRLSNSNAPSLACLVQSVPERSGQGLQVDSFDPSGSLLVDTGGRSMKAS